MTKPKQIAWERQDGLWSAAKISESGHKGFSWFASGYLSQEAALEVLEEGEALISTQEEMDESTREYINNMVQASCEALDLEEIEQGIVFGQKDLDSLTKNESESLKNVHRFEYMDDGIDTFNNWKFAFVDGVRDFTGITPRGAAGVIGSLNKKGYIISLEDNIDGEDTSTVNLNQSTITVWHLLNPNEAR